MVALVIVRIGANQPFAAEKAVFGFVGLGRPITILRYEDMRWAGPAKRRTTQDPIRERIGTGCSDIEVPRPVPTQ
jgi:hypothetical protein